MLQNCFWEKTIWPGLGLGLGLVQELKTELTVNQVWYSKCRVPALSYQFLLKEINKIQLEGIPMRYQFWEGKFKL